MIITDALYAEIQAYLSTSSSTIDEYKHVLPTFCKGNWKRYKKLFACLDLVKNLGKKDEYLALLANHLIHEVSVDCALKEMYNLFGENPDYEKISEEYQESISVDKIMSQMNPGEVAQFMGFKNDCPGLDDTSLFGDNLPRAQA